MQVKESGEKHKGSIEIPNLSEENEVDDTEVGVKYWYVFAGSEFLKKTLTHRHHVLIYAVIKCNNYTLMVYFAICVFTFFVLGTIAYLCLQILSTRYVQGFLC